MPVAFFSDTFAGSGELNTSHVPETSAWAGTWKYEGAGSSLLLSGGSLVHPGGSASTQVTAKYSAPTDGANMGAPVPAVLTALFTTGSQAALDAIGDGLAAFRLGLKLFGTIYDYKLSVYRSAGVWYLGCGDGQTAGSAVAMATLQPNTQYTAVLTLDNMTGAVGVSLNGATTGLARAGGSGTVRLSLLATPAVTVQSMSAESAGEIATGSAVLPAAQGSAFGGGSSAGTLRAPTLFGTRVFAELATAVPSVRGAGSGGGFAALTLPPTAGGASGTVTIMAVADIRLSAPTVDASGVVAGVAAAAGRLPRLNLAGYGGAVCSVAIGGATLAASGVASAVGKATATLPLFDLDARGTARAYGSAEAELPALMPSPSGAGWAVLPGLQLTAIGSAVVAATYEAYAVNLNHTPRPGVEAVDEVTRYTNFPFRQVVRYRGSYYGVAADGLYLLEGTTDYAPTPTPVAYAVRTCLTDFKSPQLKTAESAYFGGRLGAAATVTLYAGEDPAGLNAYAFSTPRGASAQTHRQVFGRGLRARYFALGLAGSDELQLDSLDINYAISNRRI